MWPFPSLLQSLSIGFRVSSILSTIKKLSYYKTQMVPNNFFLEGIYTYIMSVHHFINHTLYSSNGYFVLVCFELFVTTIMDKIHFVGPKGNFKEYLSMDLMSRVRDPLLILPHTFKKLCFQAYAKNHD